MVKRCNYASPEVEERLVRDRFVVGLLDRNLSDKLCRSPKLTLQEALTHVRQHEDAENERRARDSADSSPLAVDAAARVRNAKGKPGSPDRPNQRGCFFCGRSSHERADCPARQATCNFCSKKGHFETVCMKKRRCNSKRTRSSASSVELHAVAENRPNAKFIEVLVNGSPLSFKVDSGAEVSVVPSSFSGVPPKLQVPEGELKGPGNHTLPVLGIPSHTHVERQVRGAETVCSRIQNSSLVRLPCKEAAKAPQSLHHWKWLLLFFTYLSLCAIYLFISVHKPSCFRSFIRRSMLRDMARLTSLSPLNAFSLSRALFFTSYKCTSGS